MDEVLRADAEAARGEIRAVGIVCPSCGKNAADFYGKGHRYDDLLPGGVPACFYDLENGLLKCADGEPVPIGTLTDWEHFQAVSSIALLDEFCRKEDEAFSAMLGISLP